MNLLATVAIISALFAVSFAAPTPEQLSFDENWLSLDTLVGLRNGSDVPVNTTYIFLSCFLNVIENVTTAHELEPLWSEFKEQLEPHMETLKNCTTQACVNETLPAIGEILFVFAAVIKNEYPEVYEDIVQQNAEKCIPPTQPSMNISSEENRNPSAADRFRCWIRTIDEVVDEFELADDWTLTKLEVEPLVDQLENCTSLWCSVAGSYRVSSILINYLAKVQANNPEAYGEMVKRIQDRCRSF